MYKLYSIWSFTQWSKLLFWPATFDGIHPVYPTYYATPIFYTYTALKFALCRDNVTAYLVKGLPAAKHSINRSQSL